MRLTSGKVKTEQHGLDFSNVGFRYLFILLTLNAPVGIQLLASEDIDLKDGGGGGPPTKPGCGCILLFDLKLSPEPCASGTAVVARCGE